MFQHVGERDVGHRGVDRRNDALVAIVTCELVEPALVDCVHANAGNPRALDQIARTAVVPPGGDIQLTHGRRTLTQPRDDRMKSDEETGLGQGGTAEERRELAC